MKIINGCVYTKDFEFKKQDLFVKGEEISSPFIDDVCIDAENLYVCPSLVDIHFHGACGHDFMDASAKALEKICRYEAKSGIGTIVPATMTMSKDDISSALKVASSFKSPDDGALVEGIYMEGPFISPKKAGAQDPIYVKEPSLELFEKFQKDAKGLIKFVVLAPEEKGALDFIKKLKGKVVISLGHTKCNYEEASQAFFKGASELTHLYNAMEPLHHRNPGPICAAALNDNIFCELICDGIHIDKDMVLLTFKLFSDKRIIMISDSMMACGLEDGKYSLGGQKVFVKGREAILKDGTLAGSVTNLFLMLKNAVNMGVPLTSALRCCTYNPAKQAGLLGKVGTLEIGKRANIIFFDKNLTLKGVLHGGKWLFKTF